MGILQKIIDSQANFQQELRDNPEVHYNGVTQNDMLGWLAVAIMAEGAELLDWTNWKRHKRSYGQPLTDEQKREGLIEVVDLLHFVVNCFLEFGVTDEEEIWRMYAEKHAINHDRQANGY